MNGLHNVILFRTILGAGGKGAGGGGGGLIFGGAVVICVCFVALATGMVLITALVTEIENMWSE